MPEFKSPLNAYGIKSYNTPGQGEQLSADLHISGAVVLPANCRTVITSGITGYDAAGKLPKDLSEEIANAFESVDARLREAGVKDGFKSVYQLTTYHVTDFSDADMEALDKSVQKYFGGNRPAWAGIAIAGLYDGARIEIVATAALAPEA